MIIRAKNFRAWFRANLKDSAHDIANHGADCGFPYITYTRDTVKIFDKFGDEIWDIVKDQADEVGDANIALHIASFRRADMLSSLDEFKNLMVWAAVETLSHEYVDSRQKD